MDDAKRRLKAVHLAGIEVADTWELPAAGGAGTLTPAALCVPSEYSFVHLVRCRLVRQQHDRIRG